MKRTDSLKNMEVASSEDFADAYIGDDHGRLDSSGRPVSLLLLISV